MYDRQSLLRPFRSIHTLNCFLNFRLRVNDLALLGLNMAPTWLPTWAQNAPKFNLKCDFDVVFESIFELTWPQLGPQLGGQQVSHEPRFSACGRPWGQHGPKTPQHRPTCSQTWPQQLSNWSQDGSKKDHEINLGCFGMPLRIDVLVGFVGFPVENSRHVSNSDEKSVLDSKTNFVN